jgi:glucosamine-phosphate N-acetyltransferase
MEALKRIGRQLGCYKVILDCSEHNVNFYTRCGFKQKEVQMVAYISGNEQPRPRL